MHLFILRLPVYLSTIRQKIFRSQAKDLQVYRSIDRPIDLHMHPFTHLPFYFLPIYPSMYVRRGTVYVYVYGFKYVYIIITIYDI